MEFPLLEARNALLFPKSADDFKAEAACLIGKIDEWAAGQESGAATAGAALARELYLDLKSCLKDWVIEKLIQGGGLTPQAVDSAANQLAERVKKHGAPGLFESMLQEQADIEKSETLRMCGLVNNGELFTLWGHDYCTGMDHSLRRGARFVTTNPAKINLFRKENPGIWSRLLDEAKKENPGVSIERLISAMFVKVTAINARALKPIFDATGGEQGFVCVQTNPKNINDGPKMLEEVLYWREAYKKELGYDPVNVVYKLPAVKAAVQTVKDLVAEGVRVCMTLNFTVSQHEIFADLIQQGSRNGFVVLMAGFLDDNVAKELEGMGVAEPKKYAKWAGVAVMRKSYANLRARKDTRAAIMAAAIRGPYTIACCLADQADAPVYFTTMTEKIKELDSSARSLKSEMNHPIPEDVMSILKKSSIFNQAYNRESLNMDNLNDFIPLRAVLKVFTEAYIEIEKSLG